MSPRTPSTCPFAQDRLDIDGDAPAAGQPDLPGRLVGDTEFQKKSGDALRERIHNGTTVVFVSHMDAPIKQVCDCAVWIEHGRSVMQGPVDEVLAAYHAAAPAVAEAAQ